MENITAEELSIISLYHYNIYTLQELADITQKPLNELFQLVQKYQVSKEYDPRIILY